MNKWANLPNAKHIDWVIQSVKDNPKEWDTAWYATSDEGWDEAWASAHDAAYNAAYDAAKVAARDAMLALVAYDDSAKYLSLDFAELKCIVDSTRHPAAVLLLPAVKARELINNKAAPVVKAPLDGRTVEIDGVKYRLTPV